VRFFGEMEVWGVFSGGKTFCRRPIKVMPFRGAWGWRGVLLGPLLFGLNAEGICGIIMLVCDMGLLLLMGVVYENTTSYSQVVASVPAAKQNSWQRHRYA